LATNYVSGTQTETITTAPAGLGMVLASGSSGSPAILCGTPASLSYICNVTGVGLGGTVDFYAEFVNASGAAVVYSATQPSTITETGYSSGSVVIGAGASSSTPSELTASHLLVLQGTSTLTFGPYTLTINVND
jgi:hypothetical protein